MEGRRRRDERNGKAEADQDFRSEWLAPRGLALLPDGTVLVCDSGHNKLRQLNLFKEQKNQLEKKTINPLSISLSP